MTRKELLQQCTEIGLDKAQIQQVQEGLDFGLSVEEVLRYAKKEFDVYQMNSIRLAIKNRLNPDELLFVADKRFSGHQMEQIVVGLKEGLTLEKVKSYAKKELTAHEMCKQRLELIQDTVIETPSMFSREYFDTMVRLADKQSQQMEAMNKSFAVMERFLSQQLQIEPDGMPDNNPVSESSHKLETLKQEIDRLKEIVQEKDNLITILSGKQSKSGQKQSIVGSFLMLIRSRKKPLTIMELMSNPRFGEQQLEQIRLGYEHGLTIEDISWYGKPKFNSGRMACMRAVIEKGQKRKEN
mgnify:CR=1 FL=1